MSEGNGDQEDLLLNEAALERERALETAYVLPTTEFAAGVRWGEELRRAVVFALVFCGPAALIVPYFAHLLWRVAVASWGWGG